MEKIENFMLNWLRKRIQERKSKKRSEMDEKVFSLLKMLDCGKGVSYFELYDHLVPKILSETDFNKVLRKLLNEAVIFEPKPCYYVLLQSEARK